MAGGQEFLKPFVERAAEAEERLSILEATVAAKKGGFDFGDESLALIIKGLHSLGTGTVKNEQAYEPEATKELLARTAGNEKQASGSVNLVEENSKFVVANRKLAAENAKLLAENTRLEAEMAKLKYRITHLVQALKGEDCCQT